MPGGVEPEDRAGEVDGRGTSSSIENGNMAMNYWQITIKGEKVTASADNVVSAKNHPCHSQSQTCIPRSKWSVLCQNAVQVQHVRLHP